MACWHCERFYTLTLYPILNSHRQWMMEKMAISNNQSKSSVTFNDALVVNGNNDRLQWTYLFSMSPGSHRQQHWNNVTLEINTCHFIVTCDFLSY